MVREATRALVSEWNLSLTQSIRIVHAGWSPSLLSVSASYQLLGSGQQPDLTEWPESDMTGKLTCSDPLRQ